MLSSIVVAALLAQAPAAEAAPAPAEVKTSEQRSTEAFEKLLNTVQGKAPGKK